MALQFAPLALKAPLVFQAGRALLTTPVGQTITRGAVETAVTGGALALPGVMLGANDRKRELYDQMGPDGKYDFSITDRIFSPFTGINEASMKSYGNKRLDRTIAEANAELGLDGSKGGIKRREGDTRLSVEGRINRRRKTEASKDQLNLGLEAATAAHYLPHAVEARKQEQQRYNDTLLREAQIRADATNARQENNLMTLQLAQMSDRADHRREKAAARSQLVTALVGSLGNLGDAFGSI